MLCRVSCHLFVCHWFALLLVVAAEEVEVGLA